MASGPDTEYMEEEKRGVRKYDMRRGDEWRPK